MQGFYALDVGLGFVTLVSLLRSWMLRCFYALDVGLGFVTSSTRATTSPVRCFYALDVGLGFVTWLNDLGKNAIAKVSMPSMSGWAL